MSLCAPGRCPLVITLLFALAPPAARAADLNLAAMTFTPVTPCRLVDSRPGSGSQLAGTGPLQAGVSYSFDVSAGSATCGVPPEARGALLNFTVVAPAGPGHLTVWPWDSSNPPAPLASVLNFDAGRTVANGLGVRICHPQSASGGSCSDDVSVHVAVSGAHLVVDVLGYYAPPTSGPLWGEGRPGAARYGTSLGLCTNGDVQYGLSAQAVSWEGVASACPADTWVCSMSEVAVACNTNRPDGDCDYRGCDWNCFDLPANNHYGWVLDGTSTGSPDAAWIVTEGVQPLGFYSCLHIPVWCCSRKAVFSP